MVSRFRVPSIGLQTVATFLHLQSCKHLRRTAFVYKVNIRCQQDLGSSAHGCNCSSICLLKYAISTLLIKVTRCKITKMIIRNHPIAPRRGNEPPAQGNALGKERRNNRPERAKALSESNAFDLSGHTLSALYPGRCPGLLVRWPFRPSVGYMRIIILRNLSKSRGKKQEKSSKILPKTKNKGKKTDENIQNTARNPPAPHKHSHDGNVCEPPSKTLA